MTKEEILETTSMREIAERYGFTPSRANFISCPFHRGDRTPSMKLYKNSFHCFACGAGGDLFTFIQRMDDVSFKDAFVALGGTFKKQTRRDKIELYKACKEREKRLKAERHRQELIWLNADKLRVSRNVLRNEEPLSDAWCFAMEHYLAAQLECARLENITVEEVGYGWHG